MLMVNVLQRIGSERYKVLLTIIPPKPSRDGDAPLYSSREKMVDKDNCPIFEAWADGNRQAIST